MGSAPIQIFSVIAIVFASSVLAEPVREHLYRFNFTDVDAHSFSIPDGNVTVAVFTSTSDIDKARTVGDRVPNRVLGDPSFRLVTIVRFQKPHGATAQKIVNSVVRGRLDSEARRLQPRYAARQLTRDPRRDIFAATDFDNSIGGHFGFPTGDTHFAVLVLGRRGELLAQWTEVPTAAQLNAVLK